MSVPTIRIHVSIPANFVKLMDQAAASRFMSRSDFIRFALMDKLNIQSLTDLRPKPGLGQQDSEPTADQSYRDWMDDELRQILDSYENKG